ncbi:hypothetical protein [Petrachloros mirabilis]
MSRRLCCCGQCLLVHDTFDRANSTNLGAADTEGGTWDERSGDWQISSQTLYEAGNSGALVINSATNPISGRGSCYAFITPSGGERYRLILNYLDDAHYKYVEFYTTSASITLTAGGETRTYTTSDGWDINAINIQIRFVLDEGFQCAIVSHTGLHGCVWDNSVSTGAGRKAGMGNGGAVALNFDEFHYYEHYVDNSDCPDYGCYCTTNGVRYYPSWQLQMDFYGAGGCSSLTGDYAALEYNCEVSRWDAVSGTFGGDSLPQYVNGANMPTMTCGFDEKCDWRMGIHKCADANQVVADCPRTSHDNNWDVAPTSFQCKTDVLPFQVRWDFEVPDSDLACDVCGFGNPGTWYAIVQE